MKETRGSMPAKAASKRGTKAPAKASAKPAGGKPTNGKSAGKSAHKERALLVVESPAKARTIKKYLGAAYTVKASVGHVKDLPKSKMGVDPDKDFEPEYV